MAMVAGAAALLGLVGATTGPFVVSGWHLDPRFVVTPDTTELHLLVQQYGGAADRPTAVLDSVAPRVGYGADSISISVPVRVVSECQAQVQPTYELVVQLSEPVGKRQILPGSGETLLKNPARRVCASVSS